MDRFAERSRGDLAGPLYRKRSYTALWFVSCFDLHVVVDCCGGEGSLERRRRGEE